MARLEGKTALITGAARGLGARIAKRFADEGAVVVINDLNLDAAKATADELGGLAFACDVGDSSSVAKMFESVKKELPKLDILVNNAGISGMEGDNAARERIARNAEAIKNGEMPPREIENTIVGVTDDQWKKMFSVHMEGTFYCSREAVAMMAPNESGSIINLGSIIGTAGRNGGPAYGAAKAGILGFTRCLAFELADWNIRVNAIAPGWIETDMTDPLEPMKFAIEAGIPQGKFGKPDDIAWAAVYLASEEAAYMTGQTISPNGGWYMSQ